VAEEVHVVAEVALEEARVLHTSNVEGTFRLSRCSSICMHLYDQLTLRAGIVEVVLEAEADMRRTKMVLTVIMNCYAKYSMIIYALGDISGLRHPEMSALQMLISKM
jgi:hypothetical protein